MNILGLFHQRWLCVGVLTISPSHFFHRKQPTSELYDHPVITRVRKISNIIRERQLYGTLHSNSASCSMNFHYISWNIDNVYLEFDKSIHNHEYSIECKTLSLPIRVRTVAGWKLVISAHWLQ